MCYASMNIPRTKTQLETLCGKDHDGVWGEFVMLKVLRQSEVALHTFVTPKWHHVRSF